MDTKERPAIVSTSLSPSPFYLIDRAWSTVTDNLSPGPRSDIVRKHHRSLRRKQAARFFLYGQPSSSSGLTMASLRTSSAGAVAIQTMSEDTSAGGNAF